MTELRNLLSFMDEADRVEVLRRYEAAFDAAGPEGEAALLQTYGSPLRQVLAIEKDYRRKLEGEAEPLFAVVDDLVKPVPAEETPTADTVSAAEHPEYQGQPENGEQPGYPEEAEYPEEPGYPEEAEYPEEAAAVDAAARYRELMGRREPARTAAYTEPDEPDEEERGSREKPSGGRVAAAVALSLPLFALALLGLVVTLALACLPLLPGALLAMAGAYFLQYAFGRMNYLPDILLVLGGAALAFCLALLLVCLGAQILVAGGRLTVRTVAGIYDRVLYGRREAENE